VDATGEGADDHFFLGGPEIHKATSELEGGGSSRDVAEKLRLLADATASALAPSTSILLLPSSPPCRASADPASTSFSFVGSGSESLPCKRAGLVDARAYACFPFAPDCGKIDSNLCK